MKFKSLFLLLLIISLATISFLVDIYPALAERQSAVAKQRQCTYPNCYVITRSGAYRPPTTRPVEELLQQLNDQIVQKNFSEVERLSLEVERLSLELLKQAEITQDLNGQAAAHQVLGDLYAIVSKPDLVSSHLTSARELYQRLGNAQGSREVRVQLRQIQFQQLQLQQR